MTIPLPHLLSSTYFRLFRSLFFTRLNFFPHFPAFSTQWRWGTPKGACMKVSLHLFKPANARRVPSPFRPLQPDPVQMIPRTAVSVALNRHCCPLTAKPECLPCVFVSSQLPKGLLRNTIRLRTRYHAAPVRRTSVPSEAHNRPPFTWSSP